MNMYVQQHFALGFGCRVGVAGHAIVAAVQVTLETAKAQISAPFDYQLFTIFTKADHAGPREAARLLGVNIGFLSVERLARHDGRTTQRSPWVEAVFGLGSVAEAAALAGAGEDSHLVVPRLLHYGVTCALARTAEGARA